MRIIGVDFSGAEPETGKTWIAEGVLSDSGLLTMNSCHPITRSDLTDKLAALREPAVVAMDFPFSVPKKFAKFWREHHHCSFNQCEWMPDLWSAASAEKRVGFERIAGRFEGMAFRKCDHYVPGAKSPLKAKGNPIMLSMTFQGMKMLHQLWQRSAAGETRGRLRVAPLHPGSDPDAVTLLEVMPGATLRRLGLDYRGYKGGQNPLKTRDKILRELSQKMISLTPLPHLLTLTCRANDDALDAVIAAITAALWHENQGIFRHPAGQELQTAQLEGWLYAPQNPAG